MTQNSRVISNLTPSSFNLQLCMDISTFLQYRLIVRLLFYFYPKLNFNSNFVRLGIV